LRRPFDAVVVEEASQLPVPLAYLLAGRAREQVVLAGDFMQLPPVHACDEAADVLGRDVFQWAGIPQAMDHGEAAPTLVHLRTQYRMRSAI
jgi:superfamily I DNA and/or RNA helicase